MVGTKTKKAAGCKFTADSPRTLKQMIAEHLSFRKRTLQLISRLIEEDKKKTGRIETLEGDVNTLRIRCAHNQRAHEANATKLTRLEVGEDGE